MTVGLCLLIAACGGEGPEPATQGGLAELGETGRARMRQARAAGAVALVGQARQAIQQYYTVRGQLPGSNAQAGLSPSSAYRTGAIASMAVSGGGRRAQVTVTFTDEVEAGKTLVWTAVSESGRLRWQCAGGTLSSEYRPPECR